MVKDLCQLGRRAKLGDSKCKVIVGRIHTKLAVRICCAASREEAAYNLRAADSVRVISRDSVSAKESHCCYDRLSRLVPLHSRL